jgi:L-lactate dehydrogenase
MASEIILIDKNRQKAEGEAMDLMHGQAFVEKTVVRAGDYADLSSAQIVIITAGVAQQPGESRIDLLNRNTDVFRDIVNQLDRHSPKSVLIVATNPVDILTYVTQSLSRREASLVIGTGTMLDTGRFRALIGAYYDVDPRSVHAYILGEHGDSEVPAWSTARIGGVPIKDQPILGKAFDPDSMNALFLLVRNAAYEIIDRKGNTSTAIGSVIARMVEVIQDDRRSVLTVSVRLMGQYGIHDVCLSIPAVLGRNGVEATVQPALSDEEVQGLKKSAHILKDQLIDLSL